MPKPWRLTRQAEAALAEIARWTLETFGPRQADAYEEDLIAQCEAIAEGRAHTRSCRRIIDPTLPEDLRFTRVGAHFVVFIETPEEIVVIDFLHARSDLPAKLAYLAASNDN